MPYVKIKDLFRAFVKADHEAQKTAVGEKSSCGTNYGQTLLARVTISDVIATLPDHIAVEVSDSQEENITPFLV
jgi:hypothetical protein